MSREAGRNMGRNSGRIARGAWRGVLIGRSVGKSAGRSTGPHLAAEMRAAESRQVVTGLQGADTDRAVVRAGRGRGGLGDAEPRGQQQWFRIVTVALQQLLSPPVGMRQKVLCHVRLQAERLLHPAHHLLHQPFHLLRAHGESRRQLQRGQGGHSFGAGGKEGSVVNLHGLHLLGPSSLHSRHEASTKQTPTPQHYRSERGASSCSEPTGIQWSGRCWPQSKALH